MGPPKPAGVIITQPLLKSNLRLYVSYLDWMHAPLYYPSKLSLNNMAMINKFQDLEIITPKEVNLTLLRNNPEELQLVSITLALSDLDFDFTQTVCVQLCSNRDSKVLGNALVSLGHLARRFRRLDEQTIKPLIESSLQNPDEYVRGCAKSAADELHQFLHWQIAGHTYG